MMAKSRGSVRMGPISLLTLIITLGLAVMAVLTVTTAQAGHALVQRQASATDQTYAVEVAGQEFVAALDEVLLPVRDGGREAVEAAVAEALPALIASPVEAASLRGIPVTIEADLVSGGQVAALAGTVGVAGDAASEGADEAFVPAGEPLAIHASFLTDGDRCLDTVIQLTDRGTYRVLSWKITTQRNEEESGDTLWMGSADLS